MINIFILEFKFISWWNS